MLQITLLTKHFFFIANELKNLAAYQYFDLLNNIKAATAQKLITEEATIQATVEQVTQIFTMLSQKKEGEVNMINTEMLELLTPQIMQNVQQGNEEWLQLYTQINSIRQTNWAITDAAIENGKTFLHP